MTAREAMNRLGGKAGQSDPVKDRMWYSSRKTGPLSSPTTGATSVREPCARSAAAQAGTIHRNGEEHGHEEFHRDRRAADDGRTWWISFPGLPGVTSAADGEQIAAQARDALCSPPRPAWCCRPRSRMAVSQPMTSAIPQPAGRAGAV